MMTMASSTTNTDSRKRTRRTDPHRPGAIIPAHYEYALSFNLSSSDGGWPIPSFGINCELDRRTEVDGKTINGQHDADGRCCTIGLRLVGGFRYALGGGPGRCTVCGAHYVYGDAWIHTPTGEVVFLGHDCAAKYSLLADRSEWELVHNRARQAAAVQIIRMQNAEARIAFLAKHEGLEQVLEGNHPRLRDLKEKLTSRLSLSEKQVALAHKIAHELANPRAEETKVAAPTGKQTFRGVIVSRKSQETGFGNVMRITVKVQTPDGIWLAWGTEPNAIWEHAHRHGHETKGLEVEISATLQPGNEPHFAIMKRPRGKILAMPCKPDCDGCLRERVGETHYSRMREIGAERYLEMRCRKNGEFEAAARVQSRADERAFKYMTTTQEPSSGFEPTWSDR